MKKYEITKEQIIELAFRSDKASIWLQQNFKDAFKKPLEAMKWYKSIDYPQWRFYITNIDGKLKKVNGYGFGADGLWMENIQTESWEFYEFERCVEMTQEEVFETLKNEAIKRGYKNGNHICLNSCITESRTENTYHIDNGNLWYGNHSSANCVFQKGVWAEIIPTITKSEAEKQLGMKIID